MVKQQFVKLKICEFDSHRFSQNIFMLENMTDIQRVFLASSIMTKNDKMLYEEERLRGNLEGLIKGAKEETEFEKGRVSVFKEMLQFFEVSVNENE